MPAPAPPASARVAAKLTAIGGRIRAQRKALGVSATAAAEASGMSRVTWHRIERGEPSVTMAAYMSAALAVGLELGVPAPQPSERKQKVPRRIRVDEYPELKRVAWQLKESTSLTPKQALSLYERNWRHVDTKAMTEKERELVEALVATLGGARLLV